MNKHSRYIPLLFLCLYAGKLLVLNEISYPHVIILSVLAAIATILELKSKNEEVEKLIKLVSDTKSELDSMKVQIDALKSGVASVKLSQNMRTTPLR